MNKKVLSFILTIAVIIFSITGCSSSNVEEEYNVSVKNNTDEEILYISISTDNDSQSGGYANNTPIKKNDELHFDVNNNNTSNIEVSITTTNEETISLGTITKDFSYENILKIEICKNEENNEFYINYLD